MSVGTSFSPDQYEGGELEQMQKEIDHHSRFLVKLTEALVAKGVFTREEIDDMIQGSEYP